MAAEAQAAPRVEARLRERRTRPPGASAVPNGSVERQLAAGQLRSAILLPGVYVEVKVARDGLAADVRSEPLGDHPRVACRGEAIQIDVRLEHRARPAALNRDDLGEKEQRVRDQRQRHLNLGHVEGDAPRRPRPDEGKASRVRLERRDDDVGGPDAQPGVPELHLASGEIGSLRRGTTVVRCDPREEVGLPGDVLSLDGERVGGDGEFPACGSAPA